MNNTKKPQQDDLRLPYQFPDSVSSVSINGYGNAPTNICIATCWDNSVSCFELQANNQIVAQGQIRHDAPVLCSDIHTDNVTVFSGSCDGVLKMWNVTQGPNSAQNIGKHDGAIKEVRYVADKNLVITASWDKSLRAWDMRQPNPAATIPFTERIYAMDAKKQAVVVGTADKQIHVYDLTAGNKISEFKSPLNYQTRCVSIFHDCKGFALGCIEGRIALENFDELQNKKQTFQGKPPQSKNFAFKCHRDGNDIFSINAIHFHPKNTFLSAGSDGNIFIWDKDSRQRVSNFEMFKRQSPISAARFNDQGSLLIYSASYDWSRGAEGYDPKAANLVCLHSCQPSEVNPKDKK